MFVVLFLLLVALLALYFIIRKAVFHAIMDADDARRAYEREVALLRSVPAPDAPKS